MLFVLLFNVTAKIVIITEISLNLHRKLALFIKKPDKYMFANNCKLSDLVETQKNSNFVAVK